MKSLSVKRQRGRERRGQRHTHKKVNRFVVILFFLPLVSYSSATMKRERERDREKANIMPL